MFLLLLSYGNVIATDDDCYVSIVIVIWCYCYCYLMLLLLLPDVIVLVIWWYCYCYLLLLLMMQSVGDIAHQGWQLCVPLVSTSILAKWWPGVVSGLFHHNKQHNRVTATLPKCLICDTKYSKFRIQHLGWVVIKRCKWPHWSFHHNKQQPGYFHPS